MTETSNKYKNYKCDYGWTPSDSFDGTKLPKLSKEGQQLVVGMYVKSSTVSGKIVFYPEACGFYVQVMGCRFEKDASSLCFFYPQPIGRDENTIWTIYKEDCGQNINDWLQTFPKRDTKEKSC